MNYLGYTEGLGADPLRLYHHPNGPPLVDILAIHSTIGVIGILNGSAW